MKILRTVSIGIVVLLALAVVVGAVLPRTWHVERSVTIAAPPARIHALIANLRRWQDWSVWTKELDPQARLSFEGPESGVGAKGAWLGPKLGHGQLEITESDPLVGVKLDEAIEGEIVNAHASFAFVFDGANTRVTWTDEGTLPWIVGGYFRGVVEAMLAENFDRGLAKLKTLAEAP